ncbi:hypothetical protein DEH69_18875 [Streptomyces sp. PT12]|nr:hypothetical protein DEH69_18875 [Streptomyces sp. PT12]
MFFAERVFGPDRREALAAALPESGAAERRRHEEREKALCAALAELARRRDRQFHALELAEDPDRRFVQGVQARVAELDQRIRGKKGEIDDLRRAAPPRQDPALIDALPVGACEVAALPDAMRRRVFEAFRLQIRYDKVTTTAHCRVILCADTIAATAQTAQDAMSVGRPGAVSLPLCVVPPAGLPTEGRRSDQQFFTGRLVIEGRFEPSAPKGVR